MVILLLMLKLMMVMLWLLKFVAVVSCCVYVFMLSCYWS